MNKMTTWNIVILVVLVLVVIGSSSFLLYQSNVNVANEKSLDNLKTLIQQNQGFDRKLSYFIFKYGLLTEYLKEDAKGYAYHTILTNALTTNVPAAILSSFQIDKTGATSFSVQLATYDDAILFIKYAESPEFLKLFEFVKISPFTVNGSETIVGEDGEAEVIKDDLVIQFQGKFKELP